MRASLKYDASSGKILVRRFTGSGKSRPEDYKAVSLDLIRQIGDCDIDAVLDEARTFPGREFRMPLIQTNINHRGGLRRAA